MKAGTGFPIGLSGLVFPASAVYAECGPLRHGDGTSLEIALCSPFVMTQFLEVIVKSIKTVAGIAVFLFC